MANINSRRSNKKKRPLKSYDPTDIAKHARKKGVTIIFDDTGTTQEAKIDSPYSFSEKTKTLTIVTQILIRTIKGRTALQEVIKIAYDSGGLILKDDSGQILRAYREYLDKNPYKEILSFFEDKIPADDYTALKMSLYLRSEEKTGTNIWRYKEDIRSRFGDRGANIANLCTAGYFENEFMPLYKNLSREDFSSYYELAVGKKARALFVHRGMDLEGLKKEFETILIKALRYHMDNFRIHGIGESNVSIIKKLIKYLRSSQDNRFTINIVFQRERPYVIDVDCHVENRSQP